jgi:hypothetical protein
MMPQEPIPEANDLEEMETMLKERAVDGYGCEAPVPKGKDRRYRRFSQATSVYERLSQ